MATYGSNLPDGCNPADWWYEPPELKECDVCGSHFDIEKRECPFCGWEDPDCEDDGEGES